jgi:hypothetical protein
MAKVVVKILFLFSFSFGFLIATVLSYSSYKKVNEIKYWYPIQATVTKAYIEKKIISKGATYCPVVMVKYEIQAQPVISKMELEDSDCRPARHIVSKNIKPYKQGLVIEAKVNPRKLSQIRIGTYSYGFGFYFGLIITIFLFFILIYILLTPANRLI